MFYMKMFDIEETKQANKKAQSLIQRFYFQNTVAFKDYKMDKCKPILTHLVQCHISIPPGFSDVFKGYRHVTLD